MSSFFRKVASAFVVMEDGSTRPADPSGEQSDASGQALEDITKETGTLLAQLEGHPGAADAPSEASSGSLMELTAEDVFRQRGLSDTPNSALRLLKLVAGLSMFPREQQIAMIRAMDAADDNWAEPEVVKDAKARQGALREHLNSIAKERAQRMQALSGEIDITRKNGEAVLQELDKRIAELYARREQEAATTAAAISKLEQQQKELEAREVRARQGVSQVIQALGGLLSFLGVQQGPEGP